MVQGGSVRPQDPLDSAVDLLPVGPTGLEPEENKDQETARFKSINQLNS